LIHFGTVLEVAPPGTVLLAANDPVIITKLKMAAKTTFYVVLSGHDQWAVEVEWPDGTLERVLTFEDHVSASNWVSTQSELWLKVRKIFSGSE
jgi:hypothetical protein